MNPTEQSIHNDNGKASTEQPETTSRIVAADPFDLAAIRQAQDFSSIMGVRKSLKCKVRKPSKEWWIQTHPDPEYRFQARVLELKEEGEMYWVSPDLWPDLMGESTFISKALVLYTCKHTWAKGDYFIWPIRLPDVDGKIDDWNRSAMEYALETGKWQRIVANRDTGDYDQFYSTADWGDPEWPEESFQELIRAAFRGRVIDSSDHPVLQNLRGEA